MLHMFYYIYVILHVCNVTCVMLRRRYMFIKYMCDVYIYSHHIHIQLTHRQRQGLSIQRQTSLCIYPPRRRQYVYIIYIYNVYIYTKYIFITYITSVARVLYTMLHVVLHIPPAVDGIYTYI